MEAGYRYVCGYGCDTLGLLAYLRFEGGWGGCQGALTTEPEEMGQEP